MSVNIRKDGRLKKVAGLLPGSLATFDKDQFELVGAEKKFSLKEWIINKINKVDDIYEDGYYSNNLLMTTLESGSKNNITYTKNADGTYTLNTTSSGASANTWLIFAEKVPLKGGTYKVLGKTTFGNPYAQFFNASGTNISNDVTDGNTFSSNDITSVSYIYAVGNGIVLDNVVVKPFITTKLDATIEDYMPYAKSNVELTAKLSDAEESGFIGKNKLPYKNYSDNSIFKPHYTDGMLDYILVNGTISSTLDFVLLQDAKCLKENESYVALATGDSNISLQIYNYTDASTNTKLAEVTLSNVEFTVPSTSVKMLIRYRALSGTYNNVKLYPMICKKGMDESYQPSFKSPSQLTEEIAKSPEIIFEGSDFTLVKKGNIVTLDGIYEPTSDVSAYVWIFPFPSLDEKYRPSKSVGFIQDGIAYQFVKSGALQSGQSIKAGTYMIHAQYTI